MDPIIWHWLAARSWLVFFAEKITDTPNGIDLFRSESRQKIAPHRLCVYRTRRLQLISAEFG